MPELEENQIIDPAQSLQAKLRTAQRIAISTLALTAGSAAALHSMGPATPDDTERLLKNLDQMIETAKEAERSGPEIPGNIPCAEFAGVFLNTNSCLTVGGEHGMGFVIYGYDGPAAFAILSGTALVNIVEAVNAVVQEIGLIAEPNDSPPGVLLRAQVPSIKAYFNIMQLNGPTGIIYSAPDVGSGMYEYLDFGNEDYPGDVNGDGVIDVIDLLSVLAHWGSCPPGWIPFCDGDLNRDGHVNVNDLLLVITNWGPGACP